MFTCMRQALHEESSLCWEPKNIHQNIILIICKQHSLTHSQTHIDWIIISFHINHPLCLTNHTLFTPWTKFICTHKIYVCDSRKKNISCYRGGWLISSTFLLLPFPPQKKNKWSREKTTKNKPSEMRRYTKITCSSNQINCRCYQQTRANSFEPMCLQIKMHTKFYQQKTTKLKAITAAAIKTFRTHWTD